MSVNDNPGSPEGTKCPLPNDSRLKDPINLFNARRRASELTEAQGELLDFADSQIKKAKDIDDRQQAVAQNEALYKEYGSVQAASEAISRQQANLNAQNARLMEVQEQLAADRQQLAADRQQLEEDRALLQEQQRNLNQQREELDSREESLANSEAVLYNVSANREGSSEDRIESAKITQRFKRILDDVDKRADSDISIIGSSEYLAGDRTTVVKAQRARLLEEKAEVLGVLASYAERFPAMRDTYQRLIAAQVEQTFSGARETGDTILSVTGDTLYKVAEAYVRTIYDCNQSAILRSMQERYRGSSDNAVRCVSQELYELCSNNNMQIPTARNLCDKLAYKQDLIGEPHSVQILPKDIIDQTAIIETATNSLKGIDSRIRGDDSTDHDER